MAIQLAQKNNKLYKQDIQQLLTEIYIDIDFLNELKNWKL